MIYLDYAANYPAKKEVLDALVDVELNYYGNYNSSHKLGIKSKEKYNELNNKITALNNEMSLLKKQITTLQDKLSSYQGKELAKSFISTSKA